MRNGFDEVVIDEVESNDDLLRLESFRQEDATVLKEKHEEAMIVNDVV